MSIRRWLIAAGSMAAATAGLAAGLAVVLAASPARAQPFVFQQVAVLSWRGQGDSTPANVESSGWSAPMFYGTPEEGGPLAGLLPAGHWAPGDTVQRTLVVKNTDSTYMLRLEAIRIDLRGALGLAQWMHLVIVDDAGEVLYGGSLQAFAAEPRPLLSPVLLRRGGQQSLRFRVTLDRETDQRHQGQSILADFVILARGFAWPMAVDIHPASWPNPINPGARGSIPVAVNGGPTMDVRQLDWTTARFGPGSVAPHRPAAYEDWNGDGYQDLVLHFDNPGSGITCGMTRASLTIANREGDVYEGADAIVTPACK